MDRITKTSSRLKGSSVKALMDATQREMCGSYLRRWMDVSGMIRGSPPRRLPPGLENQELRAEMTNLRAEVAASRDGARMPPPPPPPAKDQRGLNEESFLKKVEALLERKLSEIRTSVLVENRGTVSAVKGKGGGDRPLPRSPAPLLGATVERQRPARAVRPSPENLWEPAPAPGPK